MRKNIHIRVEITTSDVQLSCVSRSQTSSCGLGAPRDQKFKKVENQNSPCIASRAPIRPFTETAVEETAVYGIFSGALRTDPVYGRGDGRFNGWGMTIMVVVYPVARLKHG
jgi:hypothetical protein